jgi:outer membrane biosynthesis protein TonB
MERNVDAQGTWSRLVAHWQPAVLVTACLAGGLTLTTMVIGSTPNVVVQASEAAIEAAPNEPPAADVPIVTEAPVEVAPSGGAAEVVDPAVGSAAAADPGPASAVALEPVVVAPAPGAAPSPAPTVAPTTAAPVAPTPAPAVTSAPVAPATVAAPQPTPAPTTAAPAPTTAAPAPTTAAPTPTTAAPVAATLTYPSFSAGSAATVVLQFDGSSIYVASVARQPNWMSQVDKNGPRTVEIKFFNTATQRDEEFHATVENGRIKVEN